jgi:hypothetical protein
MESCNSIWSLIFAKTVKILLKCKNKLELYNWLGGDKKLLSKSCCQVPLTGMIYLNFAINELSSVSFRFLHDRILDNIPFSFMQSELKTVLSLLNCGI